MSGSPMQICQPLLTGSPTQTSTPAVCEATESRCIELSREFDRQLRQYHPNLIHTFNRMSEYYRISFQDATLPVPQLSADATYTAPLISPPPAPKPSSNYVLPPLPPTPSPRYVLPLPAITERVTTPVSCTTLEARPCKTQAILKIAELGMCAPRRRSGPSPKRNLISSGRTKDQYILAWQSIPMIGKRKCLWEEWKEHQAFPSVYLEMEKPDSSQMSLEPSDLSQRWSQAFRELRVLLDKDVEAASKVLCFVNHIMDQCTLLHLRDALRKSHDEFDPDLAVPPERYTDGSETSDSVHCRDYDRGRFNHDQAIRARSLSKIRLRLAEIRMFNAREAMFQEIRTSNEGISSPEAHALLRRLTGDSEKSTNQIQNDQRMPRRWSRLSRVFGRGIILFCVKIQNSE